jgi:hypothetical protein
VFVDATPLEPIKRPIIPANLRTLTGIKKTAKNAGQVAGYRAGYHGLRLPLLYVPLALFWSVIGVGKLVGRQLKWWWHPELSGLLQEAASKGDLHQGPLVEKQLAARRATRGYILAAEAGRPGHHGSILAVAGAAVGAVALLAVVVPVLAHVGRPIDKPIVSAAVIPHRTAGSTTTSCCAPTTRPGSGSPTRKTRRSRSGRGCPATGGRGLAGGGRPAARPDVQRGHERPGEARLRPGRGAVAGVPDQGQDLEPQAPAVGGRRRPAVHPGRPHAAAGLQAARHLAGRPLGLDERGSG